MTSFQPSDGHDRSPTAHHSTERHWAHTKQWMGQLNGTQGRWLEVRCTFAAIEPWLGCESDEELGAVRVRARIGHRLGAEESQEDAVRTDEQIAARSRWAGLQRRRQRCVRRRSFRLQTQGHTETGKARLLDHCQRYRQPESSRHARCGAPGCPGNPSAGSRR
jgi:hypothetical protein